MKRIAILQVFLLLGVFLLPLHTQGAMLSDVSSHQNRTAIEYLNQNGIVQGYEDGTYRPDARINRAEFTKIIIEATFDETTIEHCLAKNLLPHWTYAFFPDVDRDAWYAKYVCVAQTNNIVSGYEDGLFRPDNEINKAEAIKIIVLSQGYEVPEAAVGSIYSDVTADDWYAPYVKAAFDANLIEDTGSAALNPGTPLSRAGMSEMTYRALVSEGGIFTPTTSEETQTSNDTTEEVAEPTSAESEGVNCLAADWTCTAFTPSVCPSSGQKTRTCTLKNSSCQNANAVKPATTQSCQPSGTSTPSTTTPTTTPTVTPTLKATAETVAPRLLVAGSNDNLVASYRFEAKSENWVVQKLTIVNDEEGNFGDQVSSTSAIASVTIKYSDANGIKQSGSSSMANGEARFSGLDLYVPANSSAQLEIYANINSLATVGDSLSGQVFRLGLRNVTNNETTFEAVSQTSSTKSNFTNSSDVTVSPYIKPFVVRQTVPTISTEEQTSHAPLNNELQKTLYGFSVKADSSGYLGLARMVFYIEREDEDHSLQLSNFSLWHGYPGTGEKLTGVKIQDSAQNDVSGAVLMEGDKLVITFDSEEILSPGSTQIYSLAAQINGRSAGDRIATRLYWGDSNAQVTGKTSNTTPNTARLFSGNSADGLFQNQADFINSIPSDRNFIWSDRSADVHSYGSAANDSSSYDWTNGYLLGLENLNSWDFEAP